VDALGHTIELQPAAAQPPFQGYILRDGSGREFHLQLNHELTFLDGLNPGGQVRKYLISRVEDGTKTDHNVFEYKYSPEHLLEEVTLPSSLGNRRVRYHYDHPDYPGVLTAIENSFGDKIQFEYTEDPTDNDERLNPRLKIQKIVDPEGIVFEYEYDHPRSTVFATISQNGNFDRRIKYQYIRDVNNTKQRYLTLTEIEVRRGYVQDAVGTIVPRQPDNPQIVRNRTEYTKDRRFNVEKEIDPLGRVLRYEYNDFNQIKCSWDFDNHWTQNTYDIPQNPAPANPIRYDLRTITRENVIRTVDESLPERPFIETIRTITTEYTYHAYDATNSNDIMDHDQGAGSPGQSTHRIHEETDERRKVWTHTYDDVANNNPLSPTLVKSPLNINTFYTYNNRGERQTITDPENNLHTYVYNDQGQLEEYIDPNQEKIKLTYYPDGNWLHTFTDQLTKMF
jgi:YD repeat-containing protein